MQFSQIDFEGIIDSVFDLVYVNKVVGHRGIPAVSLGILTAIISLKLVCYPTFNRLNELQSVF